MVEKEQGQDDYFSQQSVLLTLPTYIISVTASEDLCRLVIVKNMLC